MRLLKIPTAQFYQVAYTGPQSLLTRDTRREPYEMNVVRLWNLAGDSEPLALSREHGYLARFVFRPGGAGFLRAQGAWPEGEPLPLLEHAERIEQGLVVDGKPWWRPFVFGPDGATVLYQHAGLIDDAYRTLFHLKAPDGTVHDLYRAWGMFGASACLSPSGRLAAMSSGTRILAVWDVIDLRAVRQIDQDNKVNALAFVSDEHLVVAAGRSVRLWDVTTGRSVTKFRAFRKFADALAVSPDFKLFAAGDRAGVVRIWDVSSGREVKEYEWGVGEVREIAFSPDGATAAAAGVSAVAVWDLD
jgi:WD40 repeat protein